MWRKWTLAAVSLGGLLAGLLLGLSTDAFSQRLRGAALEAVRARLGSVVDIEAIDIDFFPPAITFINAQASDPAAGVHLLHVERARATLRPWPSITGKPVIRHLMVDGLKLNAVVKADWDTIFEPTKRKRLNAAAEPPDEREQDDEDGTDTATRFIGTKLPFVLQHLTVWNSSVHVEHTEGTLALGHFDFTNRHGGNPGRLRLDAADSYATVDSERYNFEILLRGGIRGPLTDPSLLAIDSTSHIYFDETDVALDGAIRLTPHPDDQHSADDHTPVALRVRASTKLAKLTHLLPEQPSLQGSVDIDAKIHGSLAEPSARTSIKVQKLTHLDQLYGDLHLDAVATRDHLVIEAFELNHPTAGRLTGSGETQWSEQAPISVVTRLHQVSLPETLALTSTPGAWVDGRFSGDAQLQATREPFSIQMNYHGHAADFAVYNRSYAAPNKDTILYFPETDIVASGVFTVDGVQIDSATLKRGRANLDVTGAIRWGGNGDATYALHTSTDHMHLGDIGAIAGVDLKGVGTLAATLEGPLGSPIISGTTDLRGFSVEGYRVDRAQGTLVYQGGVLRITRVDARLQQGIVRGKGALDFVPRQAGVTAQLTFDKVPVQTLVSSLAFAAPLHGKLTGVTQGKVQLAGPLRQPRGSIQISADTAAIQQTAVGPARLQLELHPKTPGDTILSGTLSLGSADSGLRATLRLGAKSQLTAHATTKQFPVAVFSPLLRNLNLKGSATSKIELQGPADAVSGTASGSIEGFEIEGYQLRHTHFESTIADGQATLQGSVLDGVIQLQGQGTLAKTFPYSATATFSELRLEQVLPTASEWQAHITGSVFSQGHLESPEDSLIDAVVTNGTLTYHGVDLRPRRPVRLHYSKTGLRLADLALDGPGMSLTATGAIPPAGTMDVTVAASGDIGILNTLWPTTTVARGPFTTELRVHGPVDNPNWTGQSSIGPAALRIFDGYTSVDDVTAQIRFAGRSIVIESAQARFGSGNLTLSGETILRADAPAETNILAKLAAVQTRLSPEINATLSGDLNLAGPSNRLRLKGQLKVDQLRYGANLDLENLVPKRYFQAPAASTGGATGGARLDTRETELEVRLIADRNAVISNSVLEAELQADVVLTGTTKRPGLIGSLRPIWARARYRDNTFKVKRAVVEFVEEFRIVTQFDVAATTQACGMEIQVQVQGSSERYNIIPSGRDENGVIDPQDALTCLRFGLRPQDFNTAQRQGGTLNAVPGGLDALWAVSGLDEKVRALLPFDYDELRIMSAWSSRSNSTTPRVVFGKQWGQVELKYSRSLVDEYDDQSLSLEYRLSNTATIQGTWVSASEAPVGDLGVDLRLHWEFK